MGCQSPSCFRSGTVLRSWWKLTKIARLPRSRLCSISRDLPREAVEAEAERQRLGLDENAFAIYKVVLTDSPRFSADRIEGTQRLV